MAVRTTFRVPAILAAALLVAAMPASAQTNDPSGTPAPDRATRQPAQDADCADGGAGGRGCVTGGSGAIAVFLPDLLLDLFPNPVGVAAPADGGSVPADPGPDANAAPPIPTQNPRGVAGGASGLALAAPPRAIAGAFVPDEVLVTVDGDEAVVQQIATAFGLEIRSQRLSALLGRTVARFGIPDGRPVGVVLAQLAADGRTQNSVPNHVYDLQQAATIVNYAFQRIALDSSEASGEDVRIAVIDTAVDETHPALSGVIAEIFDAMPDVAITARDHGTSVAGLIAGVGPFRGMAPGSSIYHARAFEGGKSTMDTILSALDWAASKDVRIINMSFVGPKNELMEMACKSARARNIVLVAAAGNNGPDAPYGYPAAYSGVTAVTATDEQDRLMRQANRGPYVFVAAPGVDMIAPVGGGSDMVTGTSFAAAIVSGAIANLLHANPERSAEWIEAALAETATDLGGAGRDSDFGHGLLNAKAAEARKE
ncbi:MAG: S8 family serine peptidase [Pseudaminobacter sp.]|nr:S8 family serine peptidase [Pseudaminobacter sp.]